MVSENLFAAQQSGPKSKHKPLEDFRSTDLFRRHEGRSSSPDGAKYEHMSHSRVCAQLIRFQRIRLNFGAFLGMLPATSASSGAPEWRFYCGFSSLQASGRSAP